MVKTYNVCLDPSVVDEARAELEVGQSLSPVLNYLLREWIKKKKEENLT